MTSSVRDLAREIRELKRSIRQLATQPQLGNSSIEGGSIDVYGNDGTLGQVVGQQFDGSFGAPVVSGPTPPTPTAPTATPVWGGATLRWDGLFALAALVPMDFSRVEVHISTDSGFNPFIDPLTLRDTIESPRGGESTIALPPGAYYAVLVARSLSGKASLASAETAFTVAALTIDALSDVDTTTTPATDGESLVSSGGLWVPGSPAAGPVAFADLTDVDWTTPPTDGQGFVWDAALGKLKPVTPSAGGGSGSGGYGTILLENTETVAAWQTRTGRTAAVGDVVFRKAPPGTLWDFRGASALPAGWARRGVASETFSSSGLTATLAAGQGYSYATPDANTDYTLEALIYTGSFTSVMQGLMANLSTGAGSAAVPYNSPSGALAATVNTSYQYGNTFVNAGGTPAYPMRLRLRKAGTGFYVSMSTNDGAAWTGEALLTNGGTYTAFGFGSILGSASMTVSWIKFTPSTSANSSGLRGWWDGSSIIPF